MSSEVTVFEHYEQLVIEGTDFYRDPLSLQEYMNRWTGDKFIELLELNELKDVLEVGIGTGRMAQRVIDKGYRSLTGIDISPRSLERARENLGKHRNIRLLHKDILEYNCNSKYDIAYSVLTFIHIENKEFAIKRIVNSLKENGILVISFDNNDDEYLEYGERKVKLFPTDIDLVISYLKKYGCQINNVIDLFDNSDKEYKINKTCNKVATIIKATKDGQ